MKKIVVLMLITVGFWNCKSGDTLSKAEDIAQVTEKIESGDYTFVPQSANPMRGKMIPLNYSYFLKVNKDTISAYLPFFGRAYSAPYGGDGGIKFESTDFEYSLSDKKKGKWNVKINVKDNNKGYELTLDVGELGYTYLSVRDYNRDPISFYGKIE